MTDIRTTWDPTIAAGDWLIDPPALASGHDLETSALISLFSDARAADDDVVPSVSEDRRGWWGGPLGSRLWLLMREKATNEVRLRAEDYCREALAWMLDDGVADRIDIDAVWAPPPAELGHLQIDIGIYRNGAVVFRRRFDWAWQRPRQLPSTEVVWDSGTTTWDDYETVWPG